MTQTKENDEKQLQNKVKTLERKLFELQAVLKEYRKKFEQNPETVGEVDDHLEELEKYNSLLINFSVAVQRLHSTFDYVDVLNTVREICTNLVGAREYGVYLLDRAADRLALVVHQGFGKNALADHESIVKSVLESGEIWIENDDPANGTLTNPKTCVPLKIDQQVFGVIVIAKLLDHKVTLDEHDFEILKLLGRHAAMAIYSAKLFWIAKIENKLNIRKEIVDLMPPSASLAKDYFFPAAKK